MFKAEKEIIAGLRPKFPEETIFSPIIESCWEENPKSRPTAVELVKSLLHIVDTDESCTELVNVKIARKTIEDVENKQNWKLTPKVRNSVYTKKLKFSGIAGGRRKVDKK